MTKALAAGGAMGWARGTNVARAHTIAITL
jgi:hypothetical protein